MLCRRYLHISMRKYGQPTFASNWTTCKHLFLEHKGMRLIQFFEAQVTGGSILCGMTIMLIYTL